MNNNILYFGDNFDICKKLIKQRNNQNLDISFIDLIYIDPPFNSNRDYKSLNNDLAFRDTWSNYDYKEELQELKYNNIKVYEYINFLDLNNLIEKSYISYLCMMSIRIHYMHKILKDTGSFYLHCDPTMSHYLKIVLDLIFGKENFRNEIVWKRTFNPKGDSTGHFGKNTDSIFFYTKSKKYIFNPQYISHTDEKLKQIFKHKDEKGYFTLHPLSAPGGRGPEYEFLGVTRRWRNSKENMQKLFNQGLIYQAKENNIPMKKFYIENSKGLLPQSLWDDIKPVIGSSKNYLRYPTQKPEALLERIIKASSNENDLVADFFCGCGTTVSVASRLKRKFIGCDKNLDAILLTEKRFKKNAFKDFIIKD